MLISEFTVKKPLPAIPDGKVSGLGDKVSPAEDLETQLQTKMEGVDIGGITNRELSKQKASRLRGRLETAKQVDVNFSEETEGNDLLLDEEEYESLKALSSFMNIPALRLGIVKPVVSETPGEAAERED